ncbi:DNA polymerase III subunit beta [Glaciecola petra]|uniref:Beta sliding clamp n=1 Tax=Glaciecola petra TaxID=3075602 RepID=A0ABU2ZQC9_9ALTE|nr:DNA polymerase III subunit beta [Aestuariibacter sp. P117]MDT0594828.1 DNA polymerase III subunit beta [Aestuariibacter sp. P117]
MNFTISRESFLQPLQLVAGAVERRHTLPILGNVLIKVDNGALWMTGTDLEVELIANVSLGEDSGNGQITVPAKKLLDIVRGLPDDSTIQFTVEENKALVKSGRSKYSLATLSADDYPNLEDWEGDSEFEISQQALKQLIESVQFSMAQQDVRYYLNGMSLETSDKQIRSVATDGHRLAMSLVDYDVEPLPAKQVIIPRKGVMEISRLIEDSDVKVKVQLGANHIRLFSNSFIFTSKLVDGRFPDYNRVVPKNTDKGLVVFRDIIKGAFSRAMILTNEKFKGVRLNLEPGELKITATNPEQEQAEEIIDVDYQGESLEIGFNVAYLIDALNAIETDSVIFKLSDSNASALVHGVKIVDGLPVDDDSSQYVIMPMRL